MLPKDAVFTTRDFLNYGSRAAVDKAVSRLVKSEEIIRVAWGVFIKAGSKMPDVATVAMVKAQSFGRTIVKHSTDILKGLGFSQTLEEGQAALEEDGNGKRGVENILKFSTDGKSSSFSFAGWKVQFISVTPRKMQLSKTKAGQVLLALWELGKDLCSPQVIEQASRTLYRTDKEEVRKSGRLMPAWLACNWIY